MVKLLPDLIEIVHAFAGPPEYPRNLLLWHIEMAAIDADPEFWRCMNQARPRISRRMHKAYEDVMGEIRCLFDWCDMCTYQCVDVPGHLEYISVYGREPFLMDRTQAVLQTIHEGAFLNRL